VEFDSDDRAGWCHDDSAVKVVGKSSKDKLSATRLFIEIFCNLDLKQ
jgi:hypothetical protein